MAGEDPRHLEYIRRCRCAAPGCCRTPCHAHHTTIGRGMSQKTHDHFAIPLCDQCHVPGFHQGGGPFKGWSWEERTGWQSEMSLLYMPCNASISAPGHPWDGFRVVKAFDSLPHISLDTARNFGRTSHIGEDAGLIRVSIEAWHRLRPFMTFHAATPQPGESP